VWTDRLAAVDVFLVPAGSAYGWQEYGGDGAICIPVVSLMRVWDWWNARHCSLADVLRLEYGHAIADTHRGLFRSRRFIDAFAAAHNDESELDYDNESHVTEYAATNVAEDFAETFMTYLRSAGRIPARLGTPAIRRKWGFVRDVALTIASGQRRWPLRLRG
jgi:hypothetical protein